MLKSQPFRVYHRRLLCQDAADSLWHYPPQAFFRQQISDGRKKFVQRLFQLFNWHLGEDLCKRYIHHGSASWVRSADKQTLPQLAELLFFTYTCGHSPVLSGLLPPVILLPDAVRVAWQNGLPA